ncbi:MAG TPA: hypothetical protein PLN24_02395 [Victivallales bacterium]|nr:hypothetical protein [Victivallales bacterium]HPO91042.1 hypothetical protein [Victivallales bacterium]HRU00230.1 hypothetical protein [Victivallales bacterium]
MKQFILKRNLTIPVLIVLFIISGKILFSGENLNVSNNEPITNKIQQTQNIAHQEEKSNETLMNTTNTDDNDGFEKVPVTTVYGPLGITLKGIEILLQRLYILFEF